MLKYRILITVSALLLSYTFAHAQSLIEGENLKQRSYLNSPHISPYPLVDEIIKDYEIFRIAVDKSDISVSPEAPLLNLKLGKQTYKLNLFQNNLTTTYKSAGQPLLLGGSMTKGGSVSLTINDNFIYGNIKYGSQDLFIEPLYYLDPSAPRDLYVVYESRDVIEDSTHTCGVTETREKEESYATRTITTCKVIDLAIANTYDMVTKYGTNVDVENHNLAVLNNVQTNYRSEFDDNIEFEVVAHYFPTNATMNPYTPNTTTTNASTLLSNFRSWAQGPGNSGGGNSGGATGEFNVDYTMASLWTATDITFGGSSGTVGLAYTPGWHHVLEDYTAAAPSLQAMVTHEKGHNFSAVHDASGSTFIMAPSVTLTDVWSTASKADIDNRLSSLSYLDNCSTLGAPTANFFQSAFAICSGNTVEYEDQSQWGATRDWEFFGGSPSTGIDEKETVTYATAGLYAVKITSDNGTGNDEFIGYVDVQAAPPTPCTPSGGNGGAGGITNVSLAGMSSSSSASGVVYEDFACNEVSTLVANTAYNLVVGVTGVQRLRFFVDYNNDGDFLDANESSTTYSFSGSGNLGLTLNTPANPELGELLRMRITVATMGTTIGNDGCTAPAVGQVEDYSVYFEEPQVLGCTDPTANNFDPSATIDDGSCTFGSALVWYADTDNDGFGDLLNTTVAVTQPAGFVSDNTDCNDNNANVNPGATEVCDGLDNNCNGQIDEGVTTTYYADNDGDGFGNTNETTQACSAPSGFVINNTDCNDNNANINPNATEICDGLDNNCNGQTDEGVSTTYYADTDGDGFGNPNNTTQACSVPNGFVSNNTDCDDLNANINPSATEICDGLDNNCNGQIDEGVTTTYYADNDGDGFGNANNATQACSAPSGFVTNSTDCNDNNASVNPNTTEVCDGIDNNCDGQVDEGCGGNDPCDGAHLVINTITQNTYRAEISLESAATVNSSNAILFTAGSSIELKPGFEVILGTDFEAKIEPCTTFAPGYGGNHKQVDLGNLPQKLIANFGRNKYATAVIYNKNKTFERVINTSRIEHFISDLGKILDKGSYKVKISDGHNEITQDILIIK